MFAFLSCACCRQHSFGHCTSMNSRAVPFFHHSIGYTCGCINAFLAHCQGAFETIIVGLYAVNETHDLEFNKRWVNIKIKSNMTKEEPVTYASHWFRWNFLIKIQDFLRSITTLWKQIKLQICLLWWSHWSSAPLTTEEFLTSMIKLLKQIILLG